MSVISSYAARYERTREEDMSLEDYLAECRRNPLAYATAPSACSRRLKLEKRQDAGCKSFEDVQNAIEQNFQLQYRKKQYDKLIDKLIAQANILNKDLFIEQCVNDAYVIWSESE